MKASYWGSHRGWGAGKRRRGRTRPCSLPRRAGSGPLHGAPPRPRDRERNRAEPPSLPFPSRLPPHAEVIRYDRYAPALTATRARATPCPAGRNLHLSRDTGERGGNIPCPLIGQRHLPVPPPRPFRLAMPAAYSPPPNRPFINSPAPPNRRSALFSFPLPHEAEGSRLAPL